MTVRALTPDEYDAAVPELAALLVDAVAHGAGVNFLAPLDPGVAAGWWRDRSEPVRRGPITAIAAREADGALVGCVLLIRAQQQNQPHRADVSKLLVHSGARRRGIARALMAELERVAREDGRWLVVLDTETGTGADATYRALGWQPVGTIPDYALRTDGVPGAATFFYKDLRESGSES
ncbi:MAG TPA: GNAT family N-acetyltransferase [Candidatus Limnocylindrales bacterium]